uniref:Uncharacterized protein n=1 Tax=viral metagenome TaxID=1070528 RepID=A0A6C0EAN0_9ZZZZ
MNIEYNELFKDITIQLKGIDYDNQVIKLKPEYKKSKSISKEYYKSIRTIYSTYQSFYNPAKYVHSVSTYFGRSFFIPSYEFIDDTLNFQPTMSPLDTLNLIQYAKMLELYPFLQKHNKLLYHNKNTNTETLPQIFYLYQFFNKKAKCIKLKKINNDKYDFIILFNYDNHPNKNKEILNTANMINNLKIILTNLEKDGSAMIYIPSIFEKASRDLLFLLRLHFENVYVFHPHFYLHSWANFIICEKFKSNKITSDLSKELQLIINKKMPKINKLNLDLNNDMIDTDILSMNKNLLEHIDIFIKKPNFDKHRYLKFLLDFYMDYSKYFQINNFYLLKALNHDIKNIDIKNIKRILLVCINDYEIIDLLSLYHIDLYKCRKIKNMDYDNKINVIYDIKQTYNLIIIDHSKLKLNDVFEIYSKLNKNGYMIFYKSKMKNVKCFLDDVKYKLIEHNGNIVVQNSE